MRFYKERCFIMWICNRDQEVVTGPLKDLLVQSIKLIMSDLVDPKQNKNGKITIKKYKYMNKCFAKLSTNEKVTAIHFVATHLFDDKNEAPELEMWMDATVDVLFSKMEDHISKFDHEFVKDLKKMIVESYKEFFPEEKMEELFGGFEEGEDRIYKENAHEIKDKEFWIETIEDLRDVILFDRDFENCEDIERLDAVEKNHLCETLRINPNSRLPKELLEEGDVIKKVQQVLSLQ